MPLYVNNGKLLVKNNALATAQACCCGSGCTDDSQCVGNCTACCGGSCQPITVTFSLSRTSGLEGSTFSVLGASTVTTCIPANASVTIYVAHITTSAADFSGATSGTRTITANGQLSSNFTVTTRSNDGPEWTEDFLFCLQYNSCVICSNMVAIIPPTGACCWDSGRCDNGISEYDCINFYLGSWQGQNTFCGPNTCTLGACCSGTSCYQTTQTLCESAGNTWKGGACSPNPCATPTCASTQTNISNIAPSNNYNPDACYATVHGSVTFTRNSAAWPAGCNCVNINGTVDDVLSVNGTPVRTVCGSTSGNVNTTFSVFNNTLTLAAIDTVGGGAGLAVTVTFTESCPQPFTAQPPTSPIKKLLTRFGLAAKPPEVAGLPAPPPAEPEQGPGTELKALLSKVGITSTPTCSCNARAAEMNRQGVQWCKDNEELILGWLKEEAEKRNLPFVKLGAKMLLRRAIYNAEKKASQPPKDE